MTEVAFGFVCWITAGTLGWLFAYTRIIDWLDRRMLPRVAERPWHETLLFFAGYVPIVLGVTAYWLPGVLWP